jgi:hypothetical protein
MHIFSTHPYNLSPLSWIRALLLIGVATALLGCAPTAPQFDPDSTYQSRSLSMAQGGISISVSVLEGSEIEDVFGARLDLVGIQPVWLKVENLSAYSYVLFLRSIDPNYFSPYEVARRSSVLTDKSTHELYPFMRDHEIERFITPGAQVEGYVYTHLDEGLKAINVDLVGNQQMQSFNMAVQLTGLQTDYADFDPATIYQKDLPSLDLNGLRAWIAALPCCTSPGRRFG